MPELIFLIGLPCSGKSTWAEKMVKATEGCKGNPYVILSSDAYIQEVADNSGRTYDQVWADNILWAQDMFWKDIEYYSSRGFNIIVDRTNLTKYIRKKVRKFVKAISNGGYVYSFSYITFPVSLSELENRNSNRKGKSIPLELLEKMAKSFEPVSLDEEDED